MADRALLEQILQIAADAKFDAVAVAFHDYETGREFSHESGRYFHAASTIKVPLLLAVYKRAEEGRIRLDDTLHVRNRFHSLADGSIFRVAGSRDGDVDLHKRIGRALRVRELARVMITRSSNLATNLLLDYLGVETVQSVLRKAGIDAVKFVRGVEDTKAFEMGINNEITAEGFATLFRVLCEESFLRRETREQMLEILHAQEFNSMIPAGLPKETRIAHKTGEISTVAHDGGIIFPVGRKPYVLTILTQMSTDVENRHAQIAKISKTIFDFIVGSKTND